MSDQPQPAVPATDPAQLDALTPPNTDNTVTRYGPWERDSADVVGPGFAFPLAIGDETAVARVADEDVHANPTAAELRDLIVARIDVSLLGLRERSTANIHENAKPIEPVVTAIEDVTAAPVPRPAGREGIELNHAERAAGEPTPVPEVAPRTSGMHCPYLVAPGDIDRREIVMRTPQGQDLVTRTPEQTLTQPVQCAAYAPDGTKCGVWMESYQTVLVFIEAEGDSRRMCPIGANRNAGIKPKPITVNPDVQPPAPMAQVMATPTAEPGTPTPAEAATLRADGRDPERYFRSGGPSSDPRDQDRGVAGGGPWDRNDPDRPSAQDPVAAKPAS